MLHTLYESSQACLDEPVVHILEEGCRHPYFDSGNLLSIFDDETAQPYMPQGLKQGLNLLNHPIPPQTHLKQP